MPYVHKFTKKEALCLYRLLCKTRALQEALIIHRGEIPGPILTGLGQEAMSVVPLYALLQKGILYECPLHFDHRAVYGGVVVKDELIKNSEDKLVLDLVRNHFCRSAGGNSGRDGNLHIGWPDKNVVPFGCSDMGVGPAILNGFVQDKMRRDQWSSLPQDERPLGLAYFGDGASNQGVVHEAMNWACTRRLPVVFAINNNKWALFTSQDEEYGNAELFKRAYGYSDMWSICVDGNDPVAIYNAMFEVIEYAQSRTPVLMELRTYRLTGHNEDHVTRALKPNELQKNRDFFEVKKIAGLDNLNQFNDAKKHEPLRCAQEQLIQAGFLSKEQCSVAPLRDPIIDEERVKMDALVEGVLREPKITDEEDRKDRSIFMPCPVSANQDALSSTEESTGRGEEMRKMKYNEAFVYIVHELMKDERVTYFGEDVATKEGGVLHLTPGLSDKFEKDRVFNAPISEEAISACGAGMALAGGKPIFEFQFAPFFWDAARIFAHAIAPQWFQKKHRLGITAVFPSGVVHEGGSGYFHEAWMERFLLPMSGIAIVAPSNAYEVVGLMRSASESPWPVAILLQTSAAASSEFAVEVPVCHFTIPLGEAHIVCHGDNFTVITYGAACVSAAKNEAELLEQEEGISVEVIDLRTVHPWDMDCILASVEKTGRCVIFHEDYYKGGVGQILKGELMENDTFLVHLLLPKVQVVGASHPFNPTDLDLCKARLPYERVNFGKRKIYRSRRLHEVIKNGMEYK